MSESTGSGISGALVLSVDNPHPPPHSLVMIARSPLYFTHPAGAALQAVTFASAASAQLTQDADAGTQVLNLSTRTGLAAGSLMRLANGSQMLVEYGVVASLGPGAAGNPGQVFLGHALYRTYFAGAATTVEFGSAIPSGAATTLAAQAEAGDGVLLGGQLLQSTTVAVEAGSVKAEYHEIGALTDSNGYYGMDGLGNVEALYLQASEGASTSPPQQWYVEYDQAVNQVDFQL